LVEKKIARGAERKGMQKERGKRIAKGGRPSINLNGLKKRKKIQQNGKPWGRRTKNPQAFQAPEKLLCVEKGGERERHNICWTVHGRPILRGMDRYGKKEKGGGGPGISICTGKPKNKSQGGGGGGGGGGGREKARGGAAYHRKVMMYQGELASEQAFPFESHHEG